jgi:hypothetical protein
MIRSLAIALAVLSLLLAPSPSRPAAPAAEVPPAVRRWLIPQDWRRDTDGPVLSLGKPGQFDDTHIFAPCVAHEKDSFLLWYSGSRGTVAQRVFRLGLASSRDGKHFEKHADGPVHDFGDGKHSILTPALLRNPDGSVLREDGKLRMWFSATWFAGKTGLHALHESPSTDGIHWSDPSPAQMKHVYAPTILREGKRYRMWYTDVSREPWMIRHADSADGRTWKASPDPVLKVDQKWEKGRLFYPTVVKIDGVYLMWYGSYWAAERNKTALGFAASLDGLSWYKSPHNPVLRPDPRREWESHYTTSQSVLRLPDGSWRIWYAARTKPPFVHKYFAIGTATWSGPDRKARDR